METFKKCLICLDGGSIENTNEENECQRSNLVEPKFRALSRYLALQDKSSLWRQATVCVECHDLLDKFEGLYQSLEKERMKVNACLKQIQNVMMEGNCYEENTQEETGIVEEEEDHLRKDILRKCLAKLDSWEPKLKLPKLRFFDVDGTLACVARPSKPSPASPIKSSSSSGNANVVIPVPEDLLLTPESQPPPVLDFDDFVDDDLLVGDMDTTDPDPSDLFQSVAENFQIIEDVVTDLNPALPPEDIVVDLNPELIFPRNGNKERAGNFTPIGFKDLGNGAHENYFYCEICNLPNITDTAEHMRLKHIKKEVFLELEGSREPEGPDPMEQLALTSFTTGILNSGPKDEDSATDIVDVSDGRQESESGNIGKVRSTSTYPKKIRKGRGRLPGPLPDYMIRKEQIMKYGQKIWVYHCTLCDVMVLGLHLSDHKRRIHGNKVTSTENQTLRVRAQTRTRFIINPNSARSRRHRHREKSTSSTPTPTHNHNHNQCQSNEDDKDEGVKAPPMRLERRGRKFSILPDYIIRKEPIWIYGAKNWRYFCKRCDRHFSGNITQHRRKHEKENENGVKNTIGRKRPGRGRGRDPLPEYIKRTGSILKYGQKRPLYHCSVCNISTVNVTLHKRLKHGLSRFPCPNCEFTCKQSDELMRHISAKHGDILFHDYRKPWTSERDFKCMVHKMILELDGKAITYDQSGKFYSCLFCENAKGLEKSLSQFKVFYAWRNHLFEKHHCEMGLELGRLQIQEEEVLV